MWFSKWLSSAVEWWVLKFHWGRIRQSSQTVWLSNDEGFGFGGCVARFNIRWSVYTGDGVFNSFIRMGSISKNI